MFITLTIDTSQNKKKKMRVKTKKFNPAEGWRKHVHMKKRNFWQRVNAWRRSLRVNAYKMDGQVAMF